MSTAKSAPPRRSPSQAAGITTAFLDRDGTVNRKAPEGDYVKSWEEFHFLPGAKEAIILLNEAGIRVVLITNQRGIALGRMSEEELEEINRRMLAELSCEGAQVAAVYHCPHDTGTCDCRKPATGMLLQAQRDLPEIDFSRSVVIGDSPSDMEAGRAVGAHRVLISDRVTGQHGDAFDHSAPSLLDAAQWLAGRSDSSSFRN